MPRPLVVVLAMLLLLTAACGGDGGSVFSSSTLEVTTTAASTTPETGATTTTTTASAVTSNAAIGDADDLVDSLAQQLAVPGSPFDEDAAVCFAGGVVDEFGFDRLVALGAADPGGDPEDVFSQMSDDEIDTLADLGLGCLDMHSLFVEQFVTQGLPRETAVCIADGVAGAPFLHDMVVGAMLGGEIDPMADPEAMTLIMNLVTECMVG